MADKGLEVLVKFHASIPLEAQGVALFDMERKLRAATGLDVRVVKDLMGDDSKLRRMMTLQQRDSL